MTLEQEERLVSAFETIAKIIQKDFNKRYPRKKPREAIVHQMKTDEEKAREEIGGEDAESSIQDWLTLGIGKREEAFLNREKEFHGRDESGGPTREKP